MNGLVGYPQCPAAMAGLCPPSTPELTVFGAKALGR